MRGGGEQRVLAEEEVGLDVVGRDSNVQVKA